MKTRKITVSVFRCTFEITALLLKSFHLDLHCYTQNSTASWQSTNLSKPEYYSIRIQVEFSEFQVFVTVVNKSLLRLLVKTILVYNSLNIKVSKILFRWILSLASFRFFETQYLHFTTRVFGHSASSPVLGGNTYIPYIPENHTILPHSHSLHI